MSDPTTNNGPDLESLPRPPLFKLVDDAGFDVFHVTEVGGDTASVGAVFTSRELAREFSSGAAEFGMESLAGLEPRELADWGALEVYASSGGEYILVISESEPELFHPGDVAYHAAEMKDAMPFPLYVFSDDRGESPLVSVEEGDGEILVAALFSSPENARAFRDRASHLDLPEILGTIEDAEGLHRHALVARQAGADYAVIDAESGLTEAVPLDEFIH